MSLKHVVIAPFEDYLEGLFAGVREFPTEKIILLVPEAKSMNAERAKKELEKFRIPVEIETIENPDSLEEVFETVSYIKAREIGKPLIVNLSSSIGMIGCAALSAAFVNGLQAFEIIGEKVIMFPILKFSYYDMLSDKKMRILELLYREKSVDSLEELSKKVKLGPSLVNYHIYGNEKNPGLKELGLVEVLREKGKIRLQPTTLAKLMLKQRDVKPRAQHAEAAAIGR